MYTLNKILQAGNFLLIILVMLISACTQKKHSAIEVIKTPGQNWLDSVRQSSDTFYTKLYQGQDFQNADYYINRKDSILTQVMKDTAGRISQLITVERKIRRSLAQYFPNGQLMAKFQMDDFGKISGHCKYYYEDGRIRSEGVYMGGFRIGDWKNYNEQGMLTSIDHYNMAGELQETTNP